ncbi:hypothetical protein C7212DRAFT_285645 [Tuber magnatum]|uniref:Uncharacterized protein n=1 Tax=Tuber magnatum TaxID=42249 RepID=A0A317SGA1_9PEZI|nr:hypothetical protein C7212DRAFT_285645 [Tuber magnatum]
MSQRRTEDRPSSSHHHHHHHHHNSIDGNGNGPPSNGVGGSFTPINGNRLRRDSVRRDRHIAIKQNQQSPNITGTGRTRAGSLHHPLPQRDVLKPASSTSATPSVSSSQKYPKTSTLPPSPAVTRTHRRHASVTVNPSPPPTSSAPSQPKLASPVLLVSRPATSHSSPSSATPSGKRAPARFSSNGIATTSGPPPSLAYRRSIAMDSRFSPHNGRLAVGGGNVHRGGVAPPASGTTGDRSSASSGSTISHFSRRGSLKGRVEGEPSASRTGSLGPDSTSNNGDDEDDDTGRDSGHTIRGLEDLQNGTSESGGDGGGLDGEPGAEDLFLNLARSNSAAGQHENSRGLRPRARLAHHAHHRSSLPADTFSSSPLRASQTRSPSNRGSSPVGPHDEIWLDPRAPTPAARHRDRRMSGTTDRLIDPRAVTPRASFTRPLSSMLRRDQSPASSSHTRSFSMAEPGTRSRNGLTSGIAPRSLHSSPNAADQSSGSVIDHDQTDSSGAASRMEHSGGASSGGGGQEDSSSVSTTAPSTVWDELDDLKSRIRRLELTGRIPASAVGATGNTSGSPGERPRTATTTVTTISSSPRRQNNPSASGISPPNSTISHPSSNSHLLLHAALAKSKPLIPPDVFKYLEAAATDAVALASAVGSTGTPMGAGPPGVIIDRQMRRKADSVCRSLTELCIALTESRASLGATNYSRHVAQHFNGARPVSRDMSLGRESILGRESALGRESLLGRESILGRESVLGGRESSILGRDSSMGSHRGLGRLSERKGSIASISTAAGFNSSPRLSLSVDQETPTTPGLLRPRNSMLLKTRQMLDDEEGREGFRSPSRAATDIMGHRHREYPISRHMSITPERSPGPEVSHRRQHYATNGVALSSPILHGNRRYFSATIDRSDLPDRPDGSFEVTNPTNERLMATAADSDYTSARYRSGSLGRAGNRKLARGLRESVDLDGTQQGGSLGRTPLPGERLLRR